MSETRAKDELAGKKKHDLFKHRRYAVLAPLAVLVLLAPLSWTSPYRQLENFTLDLRFQLRTRFQGPADPRLQLVATDEVSMDLLGRWPWPREIHGQFMAFLAEEKPAVVAWDILFTEKTMPTLQEQAAFEKAFDKQHAQTAFENAEAREKALREALASGCFNMNDLKGQLEQMLKMGGMQGLMGMMPGTTGTSTPSACRSST